jgi:hypothetical protein
MDKAYIVEEVLTDGSKVYNVQLWDSDRKKVATIGCVDLHEANEVQHLINKQSFVEGVR